MGSWSVEGEGDAATAHSYYWAAEVVGPPRVVATGRFTDRLVRTDHGWHFAERQHELDASFRATEGKPA
jgi:hypothetical protein